MKLLSAEFVTSAARPDELAADGVPHVALVGRSNVGKSTLINALARRRLARTSGAPGKTRLLNLYRFRIAPPARRPVTFHLVDLPGYGFTRGSPASAKGFDSLARAYFGDPRPALVEETGQPVSARHSDIRALLLVDARHPELPQDLSAHDWIAARVEAVAVVATKIDTLSGNQRATTRRTLERALGPGVVMTSARSGAGLDELWSLVARWLDPSSTPPVQ